MEIEGTRGPVIARGKGSGSSRREVVGRGDLTGPWVVEGVS